ncbi:MAG: xanthine dehydrogenase family protein subunit M [Planctomycetes bacterium]|jgi:carbon-monoxide dehydrogenase medium subunit|nr:xanthine dehydrogenase family protein subunit M [Planctomycetota bacterium]
MKSWEYLKPASVEEALRLLKERPGARFVAGGTDLLVRLRKKQIPPPPALISLRGVQDLRGIRENGGLRVGGATCLTDGVEHAGLAKAYPALAQAARLLGNPQIRNVATFAGNLCNASPAANLAPPLLVYEARAEIRGAKGAREVPLETLFLCPGKTCLAPEEILASIRLDPPAPGARSVFLRKARVLMDLAAASVAVLIEKEGGRIRKARVAAGAVAPTPVRLRKVEALLEGNAVSEGLLAKAAEQAAAEVQPISDLRAGADYRRSLVGVYVRRAVEMLASS